MKNKGKWQHRFPREPLEKRFAEIWEEEDKWYATTEYLLSDTINERQFVEERDREIVATVIQWLGSTCGQAFVRRVMKLDEFKHRTDFLKHMREISEEDS